MFCWGRAYIFFINDMIKGHIQISSDHFSRKRPESFDPGELFRSLHRSYQPVPVLTVSLLLLDLWPIDVGQRSPANEVTTQNPHNLPLTGLQPKTLQPLNCVPLGLLLTPHEVNQTSYCICLSVDPKLREEPNEVVFALEDEREDSFDVVLGDVLCLVVLVYVFVVFNFGAILKKLESWNPIFWLKIIRLPIIGPNFFVFLGNHLIVDVVVEEVVHHGFSELNVVF